MSIIDPPAGWDDVDGINTNERLLGGPGGPLNRAAVGLTARTKQLRDDIELGAANLAAASGAELVGIQWPVAGAVPTNVSAGILAERVIPFEILGGVGDGDWTTGAGTDNAAAFALAQVAGEQGYTIKFASGAQYKTTVRIQIHNMRWVGDGACTPIIFGWFDSAGQRLISRNPAAEPKVASLDGLTFVRCGPNPEHGINIDNMAGLYVRAKILAVPSSNGGALGVSAFYDTRRPSSNVKIDVYLEQTGDYGVQFGDVKNAEVTISAKDCYREVFGLEPIIRDVLQVGPSGLVGDTFTYTDHGLQTGDPVMYSAQGNAAALPRTAYYFAIRLSADTFKLADSQWLARAGVAITPTAWVGVQWIVRCAVCDDITLMPSTFVDDNSVRPPLFANTTGYVILTGNSGGWVGNVNIADPLVVGRRDPAGFSTCGIRLEGTQDLTVKAPKVNGCHQGIRLLNGTVVNFYDKAGVKLTSAAVVTVESLRNVIQGATLEDFGQYGVYVQHGNNEVIGSSATSMVASAIGFYDTTAMSAVFQNATALVPNGSGFSGDVGVRGASLLDRASGRLVDRAGRYSALTLSNTAVSAVSGGTVCAVRSALGTTSQYAGTLSVVAKNVETSAANTARYVLEIMKAATGATPTVSLVRASGFTAGASANQPSFTFSMSGDNLVATSVGSTSTTAPFFFYLEASGSIGIA